MQSKLQYLKRYDPATTWMEKMRVERNDARNIFAHIHLYQLCQGTKVVQEGVLEQN